MFEIIAYMPNPDALLIDYSTKAYFPEASLKIFAQ
jgi:hypothetical protein